MEYKVEDDEWLCGLFGDREMWALVYLKDQFWAGMRTTQRVESINSFFDKFVTRQTRLCEFGERYTAVVERPVKQEKDADALDRKHVRSRVTDIGIERYYRSIYTDAKYCAIQRECDRLTYVIYLQKRKHRGDLWEYDIEDRIWKTCKGGVQQFLTDDLRTYKVKFNSETLDVTCSCFKFENDGILCRHSIRVLDMNRVWEPPQKYILNRWRKDMVRKHSDIKVFHNDPRKTSDISRLDDLNLSFQVVAHEACVAKKAVDIVKRGLDKILVEVRGITNAGGVTENNNVSLNNQRSENMEQEENLFDPPLPKKKRGRPKGRMNNPKPYRKRKKTKKNSNKTNGGNKVKASPEKEENFRLM